MKKLIIVGGGASGMLAALIAGQNGHDCTIIEQNNKLGKKLYITGKGRCNLTNYTDAENLIKNTVTNPFFLYSAFYTFDSFALVSLFNSIGLKTKIERGNRVYPESEKSSDVIRALENAIRKNNVQVLLNTKVTEINTENGKITGVTTDKFYPADNVIICTGGMSYPMTGSAGDGYIFAKKTGHRVTELFPSLVALKAKQNFGLEGLSLKNIAIELFLENKKIYDDFGEMLFTHEGVSGPVILSASCFATKYIGRDLKLKIDLKPALSEKELDERILKDFKKYINKNFKNSLDDLLPQKLIDIIIELSKIPPDKKVNEITKDERKRIVMAIKGFCIDIVDTMRFNEAVVTSGGVCVDDIDPSTMQSRLIKNLYFAGEVIDVDAFTGGFNLQIAFSTAYLAASSIIR